MLVLTRKSGEKIRIGKDIIVSVVSKGQGPLKLGIDAPKEIPIYREEIYYLIKNYNQKALINNISMTDKLQTKFK
ncbi:MAG: carbon storage regulator CsrA [Candidatus Marinimicrobia bacterium]|jgi:carbon storage regulator|uniref:Carbon storage regulator n=1 Tax=marine metagenome TaxID=408172 RepID=A0A381UDW5_9ZZZZ|nr:carbon storage regulator CsrA [Candidatus Neomarinimicrobiota bacterium]|tara:strand:- start:4298 stop:4522 length:225 start_codon:yes stop_codon:yes gene_type:complete